jgi:hypothetical protein
MSRFGFRIFSEHWTVHYPKNMLASAHKSAPICSTILFKINECSQSSQLRQWLITSTGGPKNLKNCRSFKTQERHPLSKAFESEIFFKMPKKCRWLFLFVLFSFPYVGFSLSKVDIKNAFNVIFLLKSGLI